MSLSHLGPDVFSYLSDLSANHSLYSQECQTATRLNYPPITKRETTNTFLLYWLYPSIHAYRYNLAIRRTGLHKALYPPSPTAVIPLDEDVRIRIHLDNGAVGATLLRRIARCLNGQQGWTDNHEGGGRPTANRSKTVALVRASPGHTCFEAFDVNSCTAVKKGPKN